MIDTTDGSVAAVFFPPPTFFIALCPPQTGPCRPSIASCVMVAELLSLRTAKIVRKALLADLPRIPGRLAALQTDREPAEDGGGMFTTPEPWDFCPLLAPASKWAFLIVASDDMTNYDVMLAQKAIRRGLADGEPVTRMVHEVIELLAPAPTDALKPKPSAPTDTLKPKPSALVPLPIGARSLPLSKREIGRRLKLTEKKAISFCKNHDCQKMTGQTWTVSLDGLPEEHRKRLT